MNDPRTPQQTNSPRRPRDQRRTAAVVAQYLNELSGRRPSTNRQTPAEARA